MGRELGRRLNVQPVRTHDFRIFPENKADAFDCLLFTSPRRDCAFREDVIVVKTAVPDTNWPFFGSLDYVDGTLQLALGIHEHEFRIASECEHSVPPCPYLAEEGETSQGRLDILMDNLSFRNFVDQPVVSDLEIASQYLYGREPVREIAKKTGKSIGEIYRILRKQHMEPNRRRSDQSAVIALADSGMPAKTIADFTGYTARHVRNLLKKQ